jgi:hypothetical protein
MFEYIDKCGIRRFVRISMLEGANVQPDGSVQAWTPGITDEFYVVPAAHAEAFIEALRGEVGRGL